MWWTSLWVKDALGKFMSLLKEAAIHQLRGYKEQNRMKILKRGIFVVIGWKQATPGSTGSDWARKLSEQRWVCKWDLTASHGCCLWISVLSPYYGQSSSAHVSSPTGERNFLKMAVRRRMLTAACVGITESKRWTQPVCGSWYRSLFNWIRAQQILPIL